MKRSLLLCLTAIATQNLSAKDWPYFTGPDFNNASTETQWNSTWGDEGPKILWKTKVGEGAASFTVQGDRVLTSGASKSDETIFCFDRASGKVIWDFKFPCKFDKRMFEGGTASTPAIDGVRVYNLSYDGQLHCLGLTDGKVIWKTHLLKDHGGELSRWKYASSPLVMGDLLIVDNGGNGNSTLALDKKTGKKVWGKGNEPAGYATPTPIIQGGKPAVVLFKGKSLVAYDVKKGKPLWDVDWETSYDVNASSPIPLPNNQLLVTSGYGGGRAVLFDISGSKPKQLWRNDDIKTKMSSAVVHDGHVFAVCGDNDGKLVCVSLSKGKTVWEEDKFGFGTLALAGDKLLVLSDKGTLVVTPASAKGYAPISEAQVLGKVCWVKPVLAYGLVYAKNNKGSLVCLDLR